MEGIEHLESPPEEYLDPTGVEDAYSHLDGFRVLSAAELSGLGGGCDVKWGARYETVVINPPVYCAYLLRKFVLRDGEVRRYGVVDAMEGFWVGRDGEDAKVRTVVNCSGLGFGDPRSFIIRGE